MIGGVLLNRRNKVSKKLRVRRIRNLEENFETLSLTLAWSFTERQMTGFLKLHSLVEHYGLIVSRYALSIPSELGVPLVYVYDGYGKGNPVFIKVLCGMLFSNEKIRALEDRMKEDEKLIGIFPRYQIDF